MQRSKLILLLTLTAILSAARADQDVIGLRQNNTSRLQLRGEQRALVVRDRSLVDAADRASQLLLFCRQKGIGAVFCATYDEQDSDYPAVSAVDHSYHWRSFIRRAHQQGLDVYAMTGDSSWLNDVGQAYRQLDLLASIGLRGGPGAGFDGLLLEFPLLSQLTRLQSAPDTLAPLRAEEWINGWNGSRQTAPRLDETNYSRPEEQSGRRDSPTLYPGTGTDQPAYAANSDVEDVELLRQHFGFIARLRTYLSTRYPEQRLKLGCTIPAWLQSAVGWRNQVKRSVEHFVDVTDFLMVHDLPGATTQIGPVSDVVVRAAGLAGKRVYCRVELSLPLRAVPELISLYGRDELFLEMLVEDILNRHEATPGFAGVALDDYWSYRALPDRLPARGYYPPSARPSVVATERQR